MILERKQCHIDNFRIHLPDKIEAFLQPLYKYLHAIPPAGTSLYQKSSIWHPAQKAAGQTLSRQIRRSSSDPFRKSATQQTW
jgi:hypothetical protein